MEFTLSLALVSYCGRSRRLKQVMAEGSRSESSPCHWMIKGILPRPCSGTLSLPVSPRAVFHGGSREPNIVLLGPVIPQDYTLQASSPSRSNKPLGVGHPQGECTILGFGHPLKYAPVTKCRNFLFASSVKSWTMDHKKRTVGCVAE
jgi:hypothetical protein